MKKNLLLSLVGLITCIDLTAQTFAWTGFTTTTNSAVRSFTNGNMTAVVTGTAGGGQTGYSNGSITRIGGTGLCAGTPTGLLIEMSGSGNGSGSASWTNSINVAVTFTCPALRPATFSIFEINFSTFFWDASSGGDNRTYANFFDQVTIGATNQSGAAIPPANIIIGGCAGAGNQFTVGNNKIIRAGVNPADVCECASATVSINGAAGSKIKTINILYNNFQTFPIGGSPNIVGRTGISQYQYTVISPITVTADPACLLPIELLSFTGKNEGNANILEWSTETETNSDYFAIEKSSDALTFETIGTLRSAGNSTTTKNYDFLDNRPFPGLSYYRLKEVDMNGEYAYSSIIAVEHANTSHVSVYPNPAKDELFISGLTQAEIFYVIYNPMGQIVQQGTTNLDNIIKINDLAKGIYFIHTEYNMLKFVKE